MHQRSGSLAICVGETLTIDIASDTFEKPAETYEAARLRTLDESLVSQPATSTSKLLHLTTYIALNLVMTLSNKAVLQQLPTPWLLTSAHSLATSLGCLIALHLTTFDPSPQTRHDMLRTAALALLFTVNIGISNASLALVSVPLHQVLRSLCPIVTIGLCRLCFAQEYSVATYVSMVPLTLGVVLATVGDSYYTPIGLALTLLGVVLASLKAVAMYWFMTGSRGTSPLELIHRVSPLAAGLSLVFAWAAGELESVQELFASASTTARVLSSLLLTNLLVAFALNLASFQASLVAGPLALTVCGNVKQMLTVGIGIL